MYWADELAKSIVDSGKLDKYWVDDMKTPSGRVHVGALRGIVVHGVIHQALKDLSIDSTYSYVFNDMDPMDGFPHYLDDSFRQYMGMPLFKIPSPEKGHDSMAKLYATEFIEVFNSLGFSPQIIWSSQRYAAGDFDQDIRKILDNVELVRKLYQEISGYDKPKNWYPYQPICESCGKVGTTITTAWDGEKITYECKKDLVDWAEGCGHQGQIEPVGTNGKLMWKVDWATHWKVIGVTVEGAGKDHMTDGGSHDLSSAICEQVLEYKTPKSFIYEWFLASGGSKMSSSKGVGVSAKEISLSLPPEILRFLLVKTPYKRAITFDPSENQSILDLFDDFDAHQQAYYHSPKSDEARIWHLSQVIDIPQEQTYLARFRDVVNYIQDPKIDVLKEVEKTKTSSLTNEDRLELEKRIKYAKIWIDQYAPEKFNFQIPDSTPKEASQLTKEQLEYLSKVSVLLEKSWADPEEFQQSLYQTSKDMGLPAKNAFGAIYLALIGKTHGPKAAWFLLENKDLALKRFQSITKSK
jgi:lysyl-tRNA synthetase class 1